MIEIRWLDRGSLMFVSAVEHISTDHYLHKMPDPRTSFEVFEIRLCLSRGIGLPAGFLVFGRPQATRCSDWYGGVKEAAAGECEVTRWQVLNLARVWIYPSFQPGGIFHTRKFVPGFTDRSGIFRSTLVSDAIYQAMKTVSFEYLLHRPPVFLDEPYQIEYWMSYCDTQIHRGTIYKASGFELYRTNDRGIQTWRKRVPELTDDQDRLVRVAGAKSQRSQMIRNSRAQLNFNF